LAPDAAIVHNKFFESAAVKVLSSKEDVLTPAVSNTLICFRKDHNMFLVDAPANVDAPAEELDIIALSYETVNAVKKRRRLESAYDDLNFIPSTSVLPEQLFSQTGYLLSDRRTSMLPMHLESLLYLWYNKDLWDIHVVDSKMNDSDSVKLPNMDQLLDDVLNDIDLAL